MSKEELRERAKRVANRRREAPEETEEQTSGRARLTNKPVQLTVTIQQEYYRRLKEWPERVGLLEKLNKTRIPTVEVMRALIEELFSNDELRDKIIRRITRNMQ